ncbi:MAG: phosphate regulon sensor histidine kinase PhoR [Gammaproteobacteria bacterium]
MFSSWIDELWYVLGFAVIAVIVGLIAGYPLLFFLFALLTYLGWNLFNLYRLQHWLKEGKKFQPPISSGLWGEVFNEIHRLQVRNRKRKRKLTLMLNRFEQATSALPDATVVLSMHGEIEWFNDAAHKMLGLRSPFDTGQRIANLVRHPRFIEFMATADYSKTVEMPSPADNGMLLAAVVVPYGDKRLLIARDITRIQRLEQMRRDFIANISHELRTPLTVINGFLETLTDAPEECPASWARPLQLMQQQAARMQNIVSDLLMLSRLETDQHTSTQTVINVADMSNLMVREAYALSGERAHRIELQADPQLWLRGNHDELHSAFSNLIFNAVQYTPPGGEIRIRWFQDHQGAHWVISDTGDGIAPHDLPRLTERFYRVDAGRSRERGGTGLGLAIVKHALNRHAAQLHIESELGKGSVFSCDFPPSAIAEPPKVTASIN